MCLELWGLKTLGTEPLRGLGGLAFRVWNHKGGEANFKLGELGLGVRVGFVFDIKL